MRGAHEARWLNCVHSVMKLLRSLTRKKTIRKLQNKFHGLRKIVSGGQTGVDRGALDAAIACGLAHGGWCPKGRMAEDGPIDNRYQLTELDTRDYAARTERNVIDSDGTLILYRQSLGGGTLLTNRMAKRWNKPLHRVRLDLPVRYEQIVHWIEENQLRVLNVAGPRASSHAGLEELACKVISTLLLHPGSLDLR